MLLFLDAYISPGIMNWPLYLTFLPHLTPYSRQRLGNFAAQKEEKTSTRKETKSEALLKSVKEDPLNKGFKVVIKFLVELFEKNLG